MLFFLITLFFSYPNKVRFSQSITRPDGFILHFDYADNGLLLSVTEPNGNSTTYHYNENRQPDLITDCSGYETKLSSKKKLPVLVHQQSIIRQFCQVHDYH
uniref:RHS repeat domain-containing protein n=1 Tax=Neisseria sicca TaxID=490 RepID=UPI00356B6BDE